MEDSGLGGTQSLVNDSLQDLLEDERFAIESFDWLDAFAPHFLWRGGWLQTLSIKAMRPSLSPESSDGHVSFDVECDRPSSDVLSGHYFPSARNRDKPTVIVLHGMGGHALSGYMLSLAETLHEADYPVILWNHRGAGSSASCCAELHHPGLTEDVDRLIKYVRSERSEWCENGLAAVALSLGANVLLKYLAEKGNESPLVAATCVSAPLDMCTTSQNLRRGVNQIFDRYLLWRQRKELLRENAKLSNEEREAIESAGSVWELDDRFTSRRFGYDGAEEYYRANSAIDGLERITTPTLLFHAWDDPVVDPDVFTAHDWQAEGPLYPALTESGGHTGYYSGDGTRWHERATVRFFDAFAEM